MKLTKIHYKNAHGWGSLSSLKFEFSNGIKSPGHETQEARHGGWRVLDLDQEKTISKVSIFVGGGGRGELAKMKIFDENSEEMANV